ncbi:MAG: ATP-binding cassette domain-containing protein, partial [Phycisphaerae bacterium]|nr:ATP-binding cassette domain-containing protein [Phycisphaerae bacterium]
MAAEEEDVTSAAEPAIVARRATPPAPAVSTRRRNASSPPAEPVIRTEQLSIFYGSHEAVRGVSVDVPPRQVTAIIGPSGCGKSTLLR